MTGSTDTSTTTTTPKQVSETRAFINRHLYLCARNNLDNQYQWWLDRLHALEDRDAETAELLPDQGHDDG